MKKILCYHEFRLVHRLKKSRFVVKISLFVSYGICNIVCLVPCEVFGVSFKFQCII
jgi:hypothetical protein